MIVNESAENYLETILVLSKQLPVVRSVDVANELGFKKSSVSVAMKNLREKNHITVTKAGFIYLTDSGRAIAEMIYERHQLISSCLMKLGVSEKTAVEDACRIEHVISKESFDALKNSEEMRQTRFWICLFLFIPFSSVCLFLLLFQCTHGVQDRNDRNSDICENSFPHIG